MGEVSIGIRGWMCSNVWLMLGFLSSWSATIFVFYLYFIFVSIAKGDWMLWVYYGIPMMVDLASLAFTARKTLVYWKWRQALENIPQVPSENYSKSVGTV